MNIPCNQVISLVPFTVQPDSLMHEAIALMAEYDVGYVIAESHGQFYDMLTERDVVHWMASGGREKTVADVANQHTVTHFVNDLENDLVNVTELFQVMQRDDLRYIPVVNSRHELLGIFLQTRLMHLLNPVETRHRNEDLQRSLSIQSHELEVAQNQIHLSEQKRQDTEQRLALTLELSGTGAWDLDVTSGDAVWNDNHFRLMGLEPGAAEANYDTWARYVHPEDLPRAKLAFEQAIHNHQDCVAEYRVIYPNGTCRWILIRGRTVRDEIGEASRMMGISLDITEQRDLTDALKSSKARYQAILNAVPDLLTIVSREGIFLEDIRLSTSLVNQIDHLSDQKNPVGQHISKLMPPEVGERLTQSIQTAIAIGNVQHYEQEISISTPSGGKQYEDVRVSPIDKESALIIVRDISERKQSEVEQLKTQEALRESDARFQEIAHTIDQCFFTRCAHTGQFLYISPAYEKLFGQPCHTLYDDPNRWLASVHPDDQERIQLSMNEPITQESFGCEYRIIRPDGVVRWILTQVKVIKDPSSQPLKFIGLAEDITQRKENEAMLWQYERVVNAAMDGIVLIDSNYCYRLANQTYLQWYQKSLEELIGRTISSNIGQDVFTQNIKPKLDQCLLGATLKFEEWSEFSPSKKQYLGFTYAPYRDRNGTITGVVITMRDLTELKLASEALQSSDARNKAIVKALPDLLIRVNREGEIKDFVLPEGINACFYLKLKKNINELPDTIAVHTNLEAIQKAIETNTNQIREVSFYKFGQLAHEEIRVTRIDDDEALMIVRDITIRKHLEQTRIRVEQELKAQKDFLSTILNAIPSSVFVKDLNGSFVLANEASASIYGITPDEICGLKDSDLNQNAEQVEQFLSLNQQVMDSRQTLLSEDQPISHPRDGERWYQTLVSPWIDAQNTVLGIIGNCIDITDRKKLELALKRSEAQLQDILASAGASIGQCRLYPDGRIDTDYHSDGTYEVFGYSPDEFTLDNWASNIHPDDFKSVLEPALIRIQSQPCVTVEYRFYHPNGAIHWISETMTSRWDDCEGCWIVTTVGIDVSDRKRIEIERRVMEDALRLENEFRSQIIDQMAEGLCLCYEIDEYPYVQFSIWNQRMMDITGYTLEQINFCGWYQSLYPDPEMQAYAVERMAQILNGPNLEHEEWVITRSDGDQRTVLISTTLLDGESETPLILAVIEDVSVRKQVEADLRQSKADLQLITDSVPAGIAYLNTDQRYQFVNSTYERWFNRPRRDFIGRSVREVLGDLAYQKCKHSIERVLGGEKVSEERQFCLKDNQIRYSAIDLVPDFDEIGDIQGYYTLVTDVSERKRLEQALQRSQQQMQEVLDSAIAGIIRLRFYPDASIQYDYISPHCEQNFGYTVDELMPDANLWQSRIHPDDWEHVCIPTIQSIFSQKCTSTHTMEYRFKRKNNSICWILANLFVEWIDAENYWYVTVVDTDISDRKQAESKIKTQERTLRQVIDAIPNLIFARDPNGKFLIANKAAAELHGVTVAEIIGHREEEFNSNIEKNWTQRMIESNRHVIRTGTITLIPNELFITTSGESRWFETTVMPFIDADGNSLGVIGTSVDITDHKTSEENLQQSIREKDVLLSEVHHRVRNNLQIIMSLLNLQAHRTDDSLAKKALERSSDRVHAMALVHEKLYHTQYFEGILLDEYIREFVEQLVSTQQSFEGATQIHYSLDKSIELPLSQAILFSLILNELVTNALKHSNGLMQDSTHLYIELSQLICSDDTEIVLKIGNHGDVLPEDFSLTAPRTSMGLQLVMILAEQLEGSIHVSRDDDLTWFVLQFLRHSPQRTG